MKKSTQTCRSKEETVPKEFDVEEILKEAGSEQE